MGYPQEPQYKMFEYVCPNCGAKFKQASSVRLHPNYQDCPECAKIAETLTGQKPFRGAIKGQG